MPLHWATIRHVSPPVKRFLAVLALAATAVAAYLGHRLAAVGSGFAAKSTCSAVFVSGRSEDDAAADLGAYRSAPLDLVSVFVDRARKTATGSVLGLVARTAAYREGLGCALAIGTTTEALQTIALTPRLRPSAPWPEGDADAEVSPPAALASVLDSAFAEHDGARARRTRAVVVVQRGRIVAERYAAPVRRDTPLPGWSMAKSATAVLAGVLVREGKLALDQPVRLAAWRAQDDPRSGITLAQLLQMSSGLEFSEAYANPLSDVMTMLFASGDVGRFAAAKPLAHVPGTHWAYASGTTNVLMLAMREVLGGEYLTFPNRSLFDRVGMASAVFEADASGTFVGSSFLLATARDWARFGLLVLNDGVWRGERLLPAGWVRFMATAAPAAPEREYGGHWWLSLAAARGASDGASRLPADAFHAGGHGGQYVTLVPSRATIVVRLGHSVGPGEFRSWDQDRFAADVLAALPPD